MDRFRFGWATSADGATAVEYTIMVSLVAAIIVLSVVVLGQRTKSNMCDTNQTLEAGGIEPYESATDDCI